MIDASELARFDTIICDSSEALRQLRAAGLKRNVRVRTVSPYLLVHGADDLLIESVEWRIRGDFYKAFKNALRAFGTEVYDIARGHGQTTDYARTIARASVAFQNVVLNAACLSDADFHEPRLHVQVRTGNPSLDELLNGPWSGLLRGNREFCSLTLDISAPVFFDLGVARRRLRWLHQGPEYLGCRLGLLLSRWAPGLFAQDKVALLLKDCELLFETAYHLARNRIRLVKWQPPKPDPSAGDAIPEDVERELRNAFDKFLPQFVCASAKGPCTDLAIFHIQTQANRQKAHYQSWKHSLASHIRDGKRAIILSNYPGRPEDSALFTVASEAGVPMIAFQHGVSRELNANHGDVGLENSAAHLTLVYNEAARKRSDQTQFHHGVTLAVGYPMIGRRISRLPRFAFERTEPILYVSTCAYRGYRHMVTTTLTDAEMAELEIGLIRNVLNRLPYRVTYKPYPYLSRYADPDPVLLAAQSAENLAVVTDNIDARYLVGSSKVIVTARGTSTTGWCLMSRKPLCFIDLPWQMPLPDDVRVAFEEGVFLFDAGSGNFPEALRNFLSLPLLEIERRWELKRSARELMVSRFIDRPVRSPGKEASSYIVEQCFVPDFFATHALYPPERKMFAAR